MPLTSGAQRHDKPQLAGLQARLIGMRHNRGVEKGCRLHTVFMRKISTNQLLLLAGKWRPIAAFPLPQQLKMLLPTVAQVVVAMGKKLLERLQLLLHRLSVKLRYVVNDRRSARRIAKVEHPEDDFRWVGFQPYVGTLEVNHVVIASF